MTRTCLAGLALIGLLACGGPKPTPAARNADSRTTAQPASGTTKSQQRTTTTRDTTKRVNPLTGH